MFCSSCWKFTKDRCVLSITISIFISLRARLMLVMFGICLRWWNFAAAITLGLVTSYASNELRSLFILSRISIASQYVPICLLLTFSLSVPLILLIDYYSELLIYVSLIIWSTHWLTCTFDLDQRMGIDLRKPVYIAQLLMRRHQL